jgi:threonine/homoserine/homoserine lactone efflux protein
MAEISPILLAMFIGFVFGLLLSMPVGPVNLTIINTATRRGFFAGAFVGMGASSTELIYCAIAFSGFTQLFERKIIKTSMEVFTFVFFLYLGQKFLRARDLDAPTKFGSTAAKFSARLDEKFHPESSFMTGFIRVMGNLGVLLFWIVLAANFLSRDWVADTLAAKAACILGVAIGTNSWFCSLSFAASRGQGRLSEPTLLLMERFSGVCLLVLGIAQGIHIAWQLAKHKI